MELNLDFQVLHPQQCNMGSTSYRVFPSRECTFAELVEEILKRNEFGSINTIQLPTDKAYIFSLPYDNFHDGKEGVSVGIPTEIVSMRVMDIYAGGSWGTMDYKVCLDYPTHIYRPVTREIWRDKLGEIFDRHKGVMDTVEIVLQLYENTDTLAMCKTCTTGEPFDLFTCSYSSERGEYYLNSVYNISNNFFRAKDKEEVYNYAKKIARHSYVFKGVQDLLLSLLNPRASFKYAMNQMIIYSLIDQLRGNL